MFAHGVGIHKRQVRNEGKPVNRHFKIAVFVVDVGKITISAIFGVEHQLELINGFTIFTNEH